MRSTKTTLMDVIEPPINTWLLKVRTGVTSERPAGVRVVRFGNDDDGDFSLPVVSVAKTERETAEA
jgi:hypothetical protein